MVRILTLSSLYPNAAQPEHGVFVEQRLLHLLATGEAAAEVIAPVPWFPFASTRFGQYGTFARVPAAETRYGVSVVHPRFPAIPKVGMNVAPHLMAVALRGTVRRALERAPVDAIDAHYLYPDGVAAAMLARRFGKPLVLTARGSDVNVIAQYPTPRRLILSALGRAAQVITVSKALRTELGKLGADESKVEVLPNGVDLELFTPAGRKAPVSGAPRRLLIVSHLKPGKGHRAALEALASLPECTLDLAGDGPLRAALEALARALGVTDRVRFLGSVPHARLPQHYREADALLLVSEREGMPNVVLEALACGTPAVATRVGGVTEIMTEPAAGVLLDSCAADVVAAGLRELLARAPDARRVREIAERFSWDVATRGQLAIFRRLAGGGAAERGSIANSVNGAKGRVTR